MSREPDFDSMKMFVGQIPKEWTETECRQLLQEFGEIYSINLLKDKRTAKSKGNLNFILLSNQIKTSIHSIIMRINRFYEMK